MAQMIPMYSTKNFEDIYDSVETFMADYGTLGLPKTISDQNAQILFYLLYSRYGNSPIANYDENQFKVKLQATIWQFGPTWEKRLDIQDKLRKLTDSELSTGTTTTNVSTGSSEGTSSDTGSSIKNHALNPGEINSQITTLNGSELTYIDQQNTDKMTGSSTISNNDNRNSSQTIKKSKMDAYMQLWELLDNDVTNEFLAKFQKLFKQFVRPEARLIFESDVDVTDYE